MKIVDMHCDSIMTVKFNREPGLRSNGVDACFDNLKAGGYLAQFFAIFSSARAKYEHVPKTTPLLYDRWTQTRT